MTKFAKTKKIPIVVLVTVLVILLSILVLFTLVPQNEAQALTSTAGAYKAGNGVELWNDSTSTFNPAVLNDIAVKLFGSSDPIEYIKTNGTYDYETNGKNAPSALASIPYYVVSATQINASVGKASDGMVVTLGGKEWMATSLTLDNDENVVMTLMLADVDGEVVYNSNGTSGNGAKKGNNMYSSSTVRKYLLDNWSFFSSGNFASRYLVKPKNVLYQQTETWSNRAKTHATENMQNDALGELTGYWNNSYKYEPDFTYNDPDGNPVRHDAWGEDYIWLPSVTEVGFSDTLTTSCIWQLSNAQRKCSGVNTGLRSGDWNTWKNNLCIKTTAAWGFDGVTGKFGVRPAIHLNLSAAGLGSRLKNPENVTTVYDYTSQTLKSAYTAKPDSVSWYAANWYENTNNYVDVTYYDKQNAAVTGLKDAGDYWVKVDLKAWVDAVDAEVDSYGASVGLSSAEISATKEIRRPRFLGTAVTSDPAHVESDTVRWFKFTITPKELTVNKPTYNSATGAFTAPTFANQGELYPDHPELATKFIGTSSGGATVNQINTVPTKRGNYTAQAVLVKSTSDTSDYDGGNYVIKDASTINCAVEIGYQKLTILTIATTSQTYTGSDLKFPLPAAYYTNATWRDTADLVLPTGVTLGGDDTVGWSLVAKNAGTYTITQKIKQDKNSDWCWAGPDGTEIQTDQTITITVTRKTLFVDFTSSSGAFVMQKNSAVTFGVEPSNAVDGDDVLVSLQYYNVTAPQSPILVPGGKLNAAALEQGTYRLEAVLDDDLATDNCNYVLDTTSNTQDFTVSSQGINIPTVEWQYRLNNGEATAISGSGDSAANPYAVTYTGGTYVFSITMNAATLANSGVKIDGTYGTNGYQNSSQINATDNAVAVTVRFVPYSAEYAFIDQNGQQAANQYEDYTLYVKVDRATIDFTKLEWSADELEYTGKSQSVSIISGLPSFITPTYGGASGTAIGNYTAEISRLNVTDNDAAKNYIVPTNTSTIPTHAWNIVKKKVIVSWIDSETSTGDGHNIIFVPTFADNPEGVVVYTYYPAMEGDTSKPDLDKPLSVDDIVGSYDATKTTKYFACAKIRDGSGGTGGVNIFDSSNCTLILDGQEVDVAYQSFEIGDNKNPIRVSLNTDKVVYNGQEQPPVVEVEGAGFNINDLDITYKVKNSDGDYELLDGVNPKPMYAGDYKVCVSINKSVNDYAITGQKEFDYIIEKANIDLSGMKWLDTDNGNEEYTSPYTYKPGVSHKLEYIGNALDNFDGLEMKFTAESKTNADKYTVTVTFTVTDTELFNENYNVPETIEFEWEIEKYNPDLSGVKWNYNDKPFTFTVKDSEPVKQSARLIGFPAEYADELASLILYGNDTGEYSDIGKHTTSYSIKEDDELRGNYGDLMFPAGLETEINWEIHPLLVEKAEAKQTKTFRDVGYSFEEITNMPEDFAEYFDVQVMNSDGEIIQPEDGTWLFMDAGYYRIKITFKNKMNKNVGGSYDNVKWSDNSRSAHQIILSIEKLVFSIDGWIDSDAPYRPSLNVGDVDEEEQYIEDIEKYFDYLLVEQSSGSVIVAVNDQLEPATYYSIALKLKEGFGGNVAVTYNGVTAEETAPYVFMTTAISDPTKLTPIPDELTKSYEYTGEEITFSLDGLAWYENLRDDYKNNIKLIGTTSGTEVGDYAVAVGFTDPDYAWGTMFEFVRTITVTFKIYTNDNKGRFVLTDAAAASHPYKFQYEGYAVYDKDISEYVYSETDVLYMTRLAFNDTLEDLLAQFKNGNEIKVFDAKDVAITDMKKVLATGMVLRLMEGTTVLNQLTISVLGDIDGDGKIGTVDKAQLNAFTLGTRKLEAAKLLAGDIDGDGKIGTVDKAQLNAYTLGTRDLYSKLMLRPSAKSVSAQVEDVEESVTELPEVRTATVAETAEVSEEVKVKSEEKRRDYEEEAPVPATVVDTKRLRVSF